MTNSRTHYVVDYETICNCFVAVFKSINSDKTRIFVICEDYFNEIKAFYDFLEESLTKNEYHITYNGLNFDSQITEYLLKNKKSFIDQDSNTITNNIYQYAQSIITKSNQNLFLDYAPYQLSFKQIDLFKMNHWDNKAKSSSLKWIQYSMDWYNIEEMPHPHYQPVTSLTELNKIIRYCINDVLSTKKIFEYSYEQILLRKKLSKDYDVDLYSASEPRISKEIFLYYLSKKLGKTKFEIKQGRTHRKSINLNSCILPYISFKLPEFQKVLDHFKNLIVYSTKDKIKFSTVHKGVTTDYGLGGIHGSIESGIYEAKSGWTIMTSDVRSYYPNLAIRHQWSPDHIPQKEFCELYESFYNERIKLDKSDPKNYVYKIILNSK